MIKCNRTVLYADRTFGLQNNEMILSLQYCMSYRKHNKSTLEWMGRQHLRAAECIYKEHDSRLKEQFINGKEIKKSHKRS